MGKVNSGKCVIRCYGRNLYYNEGEIWKENFYEAEFFNFKKLPKNIKNNPRNEIIPLDTEKGLELLVGEIEILQNKIGQEKDENEMEKMKKGLKRLYNLNPKMIDKYNSEHAKYPSINGFSPERRRLIIKEIVSEKI